MTQYEKNEMGKFVSWFGTLLSCGLILAFVTMGVAKISSAMFDLRNSNLPNNTSYDEVQSLKQCAAAKGTPVLEQGGSAYKSCAINGKSDTRNVVK